MTRTARALAALLILTAVRVPVALAVSALTPDLSEAPLLFYALTILQELAFFALPAWMLGWGRSGRISEGKFLSWLAPALLLALLARRALTPLNAWWAEMTGAQATPLPRAQSAAEALLQALALAVIPAAAEELFFRGALLSALREKCSGRIAGALCVLAFALMHGSLAGLPGHLGVSLLLTLLMLHTDSLLIPILAHMLYNLLALMPGVGLPGAVCGRLLAVALAGLAIWLPPRKMLPTGREHTGLTRSELALLLCSLAGMAAVYLL